MGHKSNNSCLYKKREDSQAQRHRGDIGNKATEIEGMKLQVKKLQGLPEVTGSQEETRKFSSPRAFIGSTMVPTP